MNFDSDEYCTCDVGVFADCPVCSRNRSNFIPDNRMSTKPKPERISVVDLMLHYQELSKQEPI